MVGLTGDGRRRQRPARRGAVRGHPQPPPACGHGCPGRQPHFITASGPAATWCSLRAWTWTLAGWSGTQRWIAVTLVMFAVLPSAGHVRDRPPGEAAARPWPTRGTCEGLLERGLDRPCDVDTPSKTSQAARLSARTLGRRGETRLTEELRSPRFRSSSVDGHRARRDHGGVNDPAVTEWLAELNGEGYGRAGRADAAMLTERPDADAQSHLIGGLGQFEELNTFLGALAMGFAGSPVFDQQLNGAIARRRGLRKGQIDIVESVVGDQPLGASPTCPQQPGARGCVGGAGASLEDAERVCVGATSLWFVEFADEFNTVVGLMDDIPAVGGVERRAVSAVYDRPLWSRWQRRRQWGLGQFGRVVHDAIAIDRNGLRRRGRCWRAAVGTAITGPAATRRIGRPARASDKECHDADTRQHGSVRHSRSLLPDGLGTALDASTFTPGSTTTVLNCGISPIPFTDASLTMHRRGELQKGTLAPRAISGYVCTAGKSPM